MAKNVELLDNLFNAMWKTYCHPHEGEWEYSDEGGYKFFKEIIQYHMSEFGMDMEDDVLNFLKKKFEIQTEGEDFIHLMK